MSWRIVFLFTLIQVVLLNNYYGGGIVSSLLTAPDKTIKTIEDLIHSQMKVGYENVSFNRGLFEVRKLCHMFSYCNQINSKLLFLVCH